MFAGLANEVESRFDAIREFFEATSGLQGRESMVAKGLVFVQVYAVYEYTVTQVVAETIEGVKQYGHRMIDISPNLLSLFLDPELRSLRDVERRNEWDRRLQLFDEVFSRRRLDLARETGIPTDGSHYRASQLELIFRVFGIQRMPARRRAHLQRISEVVAHRNAIAHGRETAEDVGRRYTTLEMRKAIRQVQSVCVHWIQIFSDYCADPDRHRR